MPTVQLLIIGHVARDVTPTGYRLGGTATYAALTAQRLGYHPAVITAAADDVCRSLKAALAGVPVRCIPSPTTTTFTNRYRQGHRQQVVADVAAGIDVSCLTSADREAPLVLLGPIAGEISPLLARSFPYSRVGLCLQGWLRTWDANGHVAPREWPEASNILPEAQVAFVSEEDVVSPSYVQELASLASLLVVTRGERGLDWHQNGWHHQPAYPARSVDPTGAGDVLAAAFMLRLAETEEPAEAARFGACVASFAVEAEGAGGLPTRRQVEVRLGSE